MTPREARNRIVRQACLWAGAGAVLGIGLAVAVDVGLEMLLFDASPRDTRAILVAAGVRGRPGERGAGGPRRKPNRRHSPRVTR